MVSQLMPALISDRRTGARVALEVPIHGKNSEQLFLARSLNLSLQGIRLQGNLHPRKGSFLNLTFSLPGSSAIACPAIVVENHSGKTKDHWVVRFVDHPREVHRKISSYIERQKIIGHS